MSPPLIAILSDFGNADPFVGMLKGVIARLAPGAFTIDITHEIPSGDIRRAAVTLWQSAPYFPEDTCFLCVVDPGVGTFRQPLLLKTNRRFFVGPDNGLFSYVLSAEFEAWQISNPAYQLANQSTTFHGRDIFAPAAAHLARGVPPAKFGPTIADPALLPWPRLQASQPGFYRGEILHADHFGNLLTSLGRFERSGGGRTHFRPWIPGLDEKEVTLSRSTVIVGSRVRLPVVDTFASIPAGECAALVGSSGLIEIVANRSSAEQILAMRSGDDVSLALG